MKLKYEINEDKFRFTIEKERNEVAFDTYYLIAQDKTASDTTCIRLNRAQLFSICSLIQNALD